MTTCGDKWFKDANNICQKCNQAANCKTCENDANCTGCDSASEFKVLKDGMCKAECGEKFFKDTDSVCKPCKDGFNCLTCNSGTACLTCDAATENKFLKADGSCVKSCGDKFYSDSNSKCQSCKVEANCLTCENGDKCLTCDTASEFKLF